MADRQRLTDTPDWSHLPAADWPWLQAFRARSQSDFLAAGLPGPRDEDWKYTRLDDLPERHFHMDSVPTPAQPTRAAQVAPAGHRLLFRNGIFCPDASSVGLLPTGAKLLSLREALDSERVLIQNHLGRIAEHHGQPFAALNSSRFSDGLLLYLPPGCVLDAPLYCRFETEAGDSPAAAFLRLLVVLEAGSEACLIEDHDDAGEGLIDIQSEVEMGEGARLFHGRCIGGGERSQQFAGVHVAQNRDSRYHGFALSLGGGLCRNDLRVRLEGEGAEALLEGFYLLDGHRHLDNHLRVDHRLPGGRSEQFYKGILAGRSRGVFNGLAVVHPDAQRSDARQINKNLLLSTGAEMDTKPELQIEADDVKCSHGATVGYLDEEALFYLRSRGLPLAAATGLLTFAFARETLRRLPSAPLRGWFETAMLDALSRQLGTESIPGDWI